MGHEPQLLPDFTLFFQVAIFFASYFVLRWLVFRPYMSLMRLREDRTIGLKTKASLMREQAESIQKEYEAFLHAEKSKIAEWAEDERRKFSDEGMRLVGEAKRSAVEKLQLFQKEREAEVDAARRELDPKIAEFGSAIASKLLGHAAPREPSGSAGRNVQRRGLR